MDHGYGDGEVEAGGRVREVEDVGYEGRVRLVGLRDAGEVCGSRGWKEREWGGLERLILFLLDIGILFAKKGGFGGGNRWFQQNVK